MKHSYITLQVALGERSYPIYIGAQLPAEPLLLQHLSGRQVLIVTNTTVAPLYLVRYQEALKDYHVASCLLPDGEVHKDLTHLNLIFDALMQARFNRDCTVIALGGGVVGDMAGFAAASFQRGVNFIQIPTTLLAQVDSSVGGKTGINHALGKNMIGAFKQPSAVLADISHLNTLPARELSAGLAEVIKYALLCDAEFLTWLEINMPKLLAQEPEALMYAVERCCQHKARIVAADEHEQGARALLNLGHTFGHAIETHMGYGQWLHGEAVAVGMLQAADLSYRLGWLSLADVARVRAILQQANLPVDPPAMSADEFKSLMLQDKKVLAGQLRLILLKRLGEAVIVKGVDDTDLTATLTQRHFGVLA